MFRRRIKLKVALELHSTFFSLTSTSSAFDVTNGDVAHATIMLAHTIRKIWRRKGYITLEKFP